MASSQFPVAIIGMATRLPGAQTCDEFWDLLNDGGDTVTTFPQQRIGDIKHAVDMFRGELVDEDDPFFTGSFFQSVDSFDANFFHINPKEALFIEPEQRFFLEITWEAIEDAGYASSIRGSNTGVYVGNTVNKYKYILTENHPSISHGNHSPFIASRISYTHNLQGPAMMIATGCSSSLLAVHVACQGLLSGDCDMAIAGGITLDLLPVSAKTDIWNQLGITSPGAKCRAFDASAKGIAKGEGCGVVILKPLEKARIDGDHIYGVLEATTANQDGHSNGITAPHPGAQASMLAKAWKIAQITPDKLSYFETHGTGTELGDPIEISGITRAFKKFGLHYQEGDAKNKIPIGSVKANIGHLADGAAGVVSLIKVLMCLLKEKIPPAVNFSKPNPHINWDTAPVYVNTSVKEWSSLDNKATRYACVSAFGLLGTNVHAVVRDYTHQSSIQHIQPSEEFFQESQLLTLAAKTKESLVTFTGKIASFFQHFKTKSRTMLTNVCFTINTGREQKEFKYRAVVFAATWDGMTHALDELYKDLRLTSSTQANDTAKSTNYLVNFGENSLGNLESFFFGTKHLQSIAKMFIKGEEICWKEIYAKENELFKVPLLPKYAFDRVRFWPNFGKGINSRLLQLEHGLTTQDRIAPPRCNHYPRSRPFPVKDTKAVVFETMNEVLSTNYDWDDVADENLFQLGVDSLLFTQLSMKLQNKVNCTISLEDFYKKPSCSGLINLLNVQISARADFDHTTSERHAPVSQDVDKRIRSEEQVRLVLGAALNDALGTVYDWRIQENQNLFTLGCDSLAWTQVSMNVSSALALKEPLSMALLREFPTYNLLCQHITRTFDINDVPNQIETYACQAKNRSPKTEDIFPLSCSQKRLWVMEEMMVSSCVYNATNCLRITGKFNFQTFLSAANTVLSRHGAFFTRITDTSSGPIQTHDWQADVKVEKIDMKKFGAQAEELTAALYKDDYETVFNLTTGPPVRSKLYLLPDDVFYFTMVVHHIVFDGWSHFVFYNELWASYKKLSEGKSIKPDIQRPLFAELAQEEQHGLSFSRMECHMTYWKRKLVAPLPLTTFPGDKRRPIVFTHKGKRITRFLDTRLVQDMKNLFPQKYTVFVKLLSLVYALLHKYTGDNDLIIGTPVAGRVDLRHTHIIGCFINTLALRVQLPDSCNFENILDEASTVFLEAFDHQMAPFDRIVSHLNLPRDTSITPVFSINVCYHNTEIKSDHTSPPSDISVERKLVHNETSKWDMQFDFLEEPEGMRFTLEYYSDFFSDQYAQRISDSFITLMQYCCGNMKAPVKQIVLQTVKEGTKRKEIQRDLSILCGPVRKMEKSLPNLLKESFKVHATKNAIIQRIGLKISYKDLLEHAMECAWFLRKICKIPTQSRIGLLFENSAKAIEYILASLFSGLTYVPIDTTWPKCRLEYVCREAEIKVIVFGSSFIGIANHLHWACPSVHSIICVDSDDFYTIQDAVENVPLMDAELWNCVAKKAKTDIESGGWKSSYTGEHMTVEEMDEYAENVLSKLSSYLSPTTRVLEIGCASGLTTQKLCPVVGQYVATDLSEEMTTRLKAELRKKKIKNVEVYRSSADDVERLLQGRKFDLIIMNSVVHCFAGHNYLRNVFKDCEKLLDEDGLIFVGDVMDLELKEKLLVSLKSFKKAHPQCRVKTEWNNELFLSRAFMQHLCDSSKNLKLVWTSRKIHTIANELTEFRFDALFATSNEYHPLTKQTIMKQVFALKDISNATKNEETSTLHQIVSQWSNDVQPEDEAYILYTSGTTGTPKGVIISHEALVNYVSWATKTYQFDSTTVTPFFAPLTFDFTITSIFPPLLGGSVIEIFEPFQDSYQALASSTDITIAKYSPLQLDMILSASKQPLSASTFILGGEELTASLLNKLKAKKGKDLFVVWNEYGPTEATVGCVVRCLKSDELPLAQYEYVPIGKPIDNVIVAVVRNGQYPVPQGAKGHLAIGGKCLCKDFAGSSTSRDEKRSRSFRSSCWGRPGELMLLTEDIVELMPTSDELVHFGRDRGSETAKINGIRVDLIEVQQMIEADPMVSSAWVCTFVHEKQTLLGAAVKLEDNKQELKCSDLTWKQQLVLSLTQVLPRRSIPKVFVQLSAPPTNKNGKKNVGFLEKLFLSEMITGKNDSLYVTDSSYAVKSFGLTKKLQQIWQSILPVDRLPKPDDDFFYDLSGDSLQAIHLVRKMRNEGFQVSVTDIFQNSSIKKLLPILGKQIEGKYSKDVSCEVEQTPFRPTPIIENFFERNPPLKQPNRFSLPALLQFQNPISPQILKNALKSVMIKHGSLRSRFSVEDGRVFQQVTPAEANELKVELLEIEKTKDQVTNELVFIELCDRLEQSHSLEMGNLVNSAIIKVRKVEFPCNEEYFALIVVHHIALDIVSWQQVLHDLASALSILSKNVKEEPALEKCQVTFQTYCRQLQIETDRLFIDEIEYWQNIEKESKTSGRLVQEDKQSTFRTAKWINEETDAKLIRTTCRKLGCSDENIILTAFGRAFVAIHGQDKTCICLESHGRHLKNIDSTDTVGWCTSSFPVILNTPPSGDVLSQVKNLGYMISKIPNHGLGFGLLKSRRTLSMPLPKIMFVHQGSIDASTKESFEGGRFSFIHVPWIEVMLNELKERRFHMHPEEFLEYDLEIITWFHGGKLKFGCLFDEEIVGEDVIKNIIKHVKLNIMIISEKARNEQKEISIEFISGFNITPELVSSMTESLAQHNTIVKQTRVQPPEQMLQLLCTTNSTTSQPMADVVVIIPRPTNTDQARELINICNQPKSRLATSKTVIWVNTEHLPNTSEVLKSLPANVFSLEINPETLSTFYDSISDTGYNMPLTRIGYCTLGVSLARAIRAYIWGSKYKVIIVDADYTLWDGECAQAPVRFNEANYELHNFLLQRKAEGMLLVVLSKNNQDDVDSVFKQQRKDMKVQKDDFTLIVANWEAKSTNIRNVSELLNLGIDSFVFIDDNPVECEEMILNCPEVLTLQLPSSANLVAHLLQNLWLLDRVEVSVEASKRTEIYRNELERQEDLQGVRANNRDNKNNVSELLLSWKMKLSICKTNIGSLKSIKRLYTRVEELLQRTNQFKMNDFNTDIRQANDDEIIWLLSLKDKHGIYGIVSILIMNTTLDDILITQWVVSCRALGRGVEARTLDEIHKDAYIRRNASNVRLAISKTSRNTPAMNFLQSVDIQTSDVSPSELKIVSINSSNLVSSQKNLHVVKEVPNLDVFFEESQAQSKESGIKKSNEKTASTMVSGEVTNFSKNFVNSYSGTSLGQVNEWIKTTWSKSQKNQALYHNTFPIITNAKLVIDQKTPDLKTYEKQMVLKTSWMEVLQTEKEPEDSDKFVASGGTSFNAVYLVSMLRRLCSIEISIADVLHNKTYGEIKEIVEEARPFADEPTLLPQVERSSKLLLSSAQQRMILIQHTNPGSSAYVETLAFRTRRIINPKEIISTLVQQHPILKSKIVIDKETLEYSRSIQCAMNIDVMFEEVPSRAISVGFLKETTPVLNVINSSLFQARFLTADEESVFALHLHHVIVDDVTLANLATDLQELVSGRFPTDDRHSAGRDDYDDHVNEEVTYLVSEKGSNDDAFWKTKFESLPEDSNLAICPKTDITSLDTKIFKAKQSNRVIVEQMSDKLTEYCRMHDLTEFQYYLSCVALVLQRYLGVDEITLAIPVTTRTANHEKTDGLFVNTVLFRIPVDPELTFKEHCRVVVSLWLETLNHSKYPFDQVIRSLWKLHGKNSNTFCSVMFNFAVQHRNEDEVSVPAKHAKMPFSVDVLKDDSGRTTLVAEWADEFIDDGIADRIISSLFHVSTTVYKKDEKSLCEVQILCEEERNLLKSFHTNLVDSTATLIPVHLSFEKFAKATPRATAVSINDRNLSYRQLNELSSKICNALLEKIPQGKLKTHPVLIMAKKDEFTIAAILGVWKTGGHFLPVGIANRTSLQHILRRSKPAAVLTNLPIQELQINEEEDQGCPLFFIQDLAERSNYMFERPVPTVSSEDLAYIIQTSGSTGSPKQCKISHRSLRIIADAWKDRYRMTEFDVNVLQWAPLSFDVFVGDVVRALICTSGQLTICPEERRLDIPFILKLMKEHHVTMAEVTPLFGHQVFENSCNDDLALMKVFILGSDILPKQVYRKIRDKFKTCQRVVNSYGMTEATIDSAFFEGDIVPTTRSDTVPIGKPLPGVHLHVLNPKSLLPCPVGTVGELYISGHVLASGDVDLLSVPHIRCEALKTGDSACFLPSGDLELLGRMDNMVKLRGFRISTTEIENKITEAIDNVTHACVVPQKDEENNGSEFLCAFLVVDQHGRTDLVIDRNYVCSKIKGQLPYYMLPDIVHVIPEIPLSANGKVNHKALPSVLNLVESIAIPQTTNVESSVMVTLKALFADALGLQHPDQIDPHLTFMEQGGHSLILVRFSTLITQKTSFGSTIADIFSYPTIAALEQFIMQKEEHRNDLINSPTEHLTFFSSKIQKIAITGIALRLPGSIMTLPQLWQALEKENDLIGEFPDTRAKDILQSVSLEDEQILSDAETFQGSFLDNVDGFDNKFFNIPPGEAKFMSPEQRIFLQVATEALAESKPLSEVYGSKIGVFVGASEIWYSRLQHPDEATCISGLLPGMIATRLAYQWDLKGPTMLVDTACSSSLMALKEACESIKREECDAALVGGVSLVMYPSRTGVFGKTSILSEDFRCRAFDKDATGTAVGEGVMCLYVEPLEKAIAENKPIYGVIRSIASNSVGRGNGITAPSASSQRDVIQSALNIARVRPSEVTYIEGHGTGTKLGDRIELSALRSVFGISRQFETNLSIGSVKSVFGHLDSAAGLLGVFKTLASLVAKKIPPTVHFKSPHPELFNSGLEVCNKTVDWNLSSSTNSRIAGVSSFGLTGTNCHAIISEATTTAGNQARKIIEGKYHLFIAGSNLAQLTNQLHLHKIHIKQFIIKLGISTVAGLCRTVANRLKEVMKIKSDMEWRLVITAENASGMTKAVEIAERATDLTAMKQLAKVRSDIEFHCPEHDDIKTGFSNVKSFLQHGKIQVNDPVHGDTQETSFSQGVTLAIYNETRHWVDKRGEIKRNSCHMDVGELLQKKLSETQELVRTLPLVPPADLQETLGKFCSAIIIKLFLSTSLNEYVLNGKNVTFKNAFSLSEMMPKYEKFFFVMVRELLRNEFLRATGTDKSIHCLDSFEFESQHILNVDPSVIAERAIKSYPAWADCFRFPIYCSKYLKKVVSGGMSPLSVIYPHGDLNFMLQFDKVGDLLGDVYYNMYMQLIASHVKQLTEQGKQVRILEVGAGVGHVTRQILPKLKDTPNIEYWFTDLGKAFVEHAKTTFSEYLGIMKFATFDITKNAPKQGLLGSFDIIVSYNVIHTTQSIIESVLNLKSCMADDGKIFIIESAKNETWATLAWGILDGWWYFKDYDLRPAEPMMEPEKWERVLKSVGFQSVITCPSKSEERKHVEKFLFLCCARPLSNARQSSEVAVSLPWWETDLNRFNAVKKLDALQNEENSTSNVELINDDGDQRIYEELRNIWSELLGKTAISPEDDFNSLGGESLLAIQMMNLVKKRIGFQLEIADTFGYPTLGSLANYITTELKKDTKVDVANEAHTLTEPSKLKDENLLSCSKTEITLGSSAGDFSTSNDKANEQKGTMLMFPGQGSQKVGMCVSMKDSKEARELFKTAEDVLGYNVLNICLGDEAILKQKLKSTEFVQVALFVSCLAKIEQLKTERPETLADVKLVAGLSVGEFAALVYAGVFGFRDALKIVAERGKAMDSTVRETPTGMVSVFGPECEQLEAFLKKYYPGMKISTYLADNQHTVAGLEEECISLVESMSKVHKEDMSVIDVRKLRVAGGFHSPYMNQPSEEVNKLIMCSELSNPTLPIIMNVSGELVSEQLEVKKLLCQQLTAPVKWKHSVTTAFGLGVRRFVEIAPGRVLSSIVKNRIKECHGCDVEFVQV